MKLNKRWFLARARERSTWVGAVAVVSAMGISVNPDLMQQIVTVGMALAGLVSTLTKDNPDKE